MPRVPVSIRPAVAAAVPAGMACVLRRVVGRITGIVAMTLLLAGVAQAQTYTLTIRGAGTGNGGVTAPATGGQPPMNCAVANSLTSGTCARTYARATAVTLTATALTGSVFTGWTGACSGAAPSCTVRNLTGAQSAIATFAPACTLSVTPTAGGAAAVTAGGTGGACGRSVTVTAAPNATFTFLGWNNGATVLSTTNPYTFTLTSTLALTARFAAVPQCTLTIGTATGGTAALTAGTLTGNCGRSATVTATAASGYRLGTWSDGGTGSPYTFTVTGTSQVLTPVFVQQCAATLATAPAGAGTVALSSGTLAGDCGRSVTVLATPNAAFRFSAFTEAGGVSNTTNPLVTTVSAPRAITAVFEAVPQCALVLAAVPADGGAVTFSSGAATGDCGRSVTVVATPARNFMFTGWSEAAASATYTLTVTQTSQPLSAQFASATAVRIVISGAQGRVLRGATGAAGAEVCALGSTATEAACSVSAGAEQLVAAPTSASGFIGWRGACTGRGACALASIGGQEVKALFVPVRDINADVAARDLLSGQGLSPADRDLLDQTGNGDGTYDLGDLLAHLERTSQALSPQLSAQVLSSPVPLRQPSSVRVAPARRP